MSVSMVGKGYLAICEVAVFARLGEFIIPFSLRTIFNGLTLVIRDSVAFGLLRFKIAFCKELGYSCSDLKK